MTNRFLTKHEPLLVYQGDISGFKPDNSTVPLFWSYYVKGAARATSVLMLAHVCLIKLNADLVVLSPKLYETLLSMSCLLGTPAIDASSIALENARRSSRGSIQKMHGITWLAKLNTLTQEEFSPTEVIRRWNDTCTKSGALEGQKKLALKQPCIQLLLDHVPEFGPEGSAFTDAAFANKHLIPGFGPRVGEKSWQQRLTITDEGFELFLRYVHHRCTRAKGATNSQQVRQECLKRGIVNERAAGVRHCRIEGPAPHQRRGDLDGDPIISRWGHQFRVGTAKRHVGEEETISADGFVQAENPAGHYLSRPRLQADLHGQRPRYHCWPVGKASF